LFLLGICHWLFNTHWEQVESRLQIISAHVTPTQFVKIAGNVKSDHSSNSLTLDITVSSIVRVTEKKLRPVSATSHVVTCCRNRDTCNSGLLP
jgi:hypothetical protein